MMDSQQGEKTADPRPASEELARKGCGDRSLLPVQQTLWEQLSLTILVLVYLLASVRYFPGQAMHSLVETLIHLLSVAPITLGATLLIVAVLQRLVKERLPFSRTLRLFLVMAICLELILGLAHFFEINGAV